MTLWKESFTLVNGTRTHYLEAGTKAETIFLIHGGNPWACAEINWGSVIPLFATTFHVLAADQIGHGLSDPPKSDFSLRGKGEHLISLLDHLNESHVHLVGNSYGGWLGIYISLKRPDLVKRLVIVNSGSSSWLWTRDIEKDHPEWFSRHRERPTLESVKNELLDSTFHEDLITPELTERALEIASRNFETNRQRMELTHSTWERANENHGLDGKHISEYVGQLEIPVLLVWGSRDYSAPLERGFSLFSKIKGAEMHVFDEAKHHVMVDQPKRFVDVVTDFLTA